MRVLVTGGAGFIGSAYVRAVLGGAYPSMRPSAVTVLDKRTYAATAGALDAVRSDPRLDVVTGDVCDPATAYEVTRGHDLVVHFAAESHVDRSIGAGYPFALSNVVGTQVMLDAARAAGVGRFLHVSTDEVYGSIDVGSWTEGDPLNPTSPYAASKAGADLIALAAHRTHGLDVVITRCGNNYGPYQFPEKIIPLFVTNLLLGRPVPLYGTGANVRDWVHVDDHCRGVQLAVDRGVAGRIYHVGGGTQLTNRELTSRLLAACGADWSSVEQVADRPGHDRRYSLDIGRARDELGYAPRVPFDAGLSATVDWYREHRAWWEPLR